MSFSGQVFSVGQILTATVMNQMDANVDEVRTHHAGTSAPAELATGVVWLDTTNNGAWVLKIRDNGGDWITLFTIDNTANTATATTASSGDFLGEVPQTNAGANATEFAGPIFNFRNMIINGQFDFWQRGTSIASPASDDYTADRFKWRRSGTGVVTVQRSTTVPGVLSKYSCHIDVTTADASLAAGDFYCLEQPIEGFISRRNYWPDTALGHIMKVSFLVYTDKIGTYCIAVQNDGRTRSQVREYTVSQSNTWTRVDLTINLPQDGTWETDEDVGMRLIFCFGAGSTYQSPDILDFATGNYFCSSNQTNLMDNAANNFRIAEVQFEISQNRTPFEQRPYAVERLLCERYYRKTFLPDTTPAQNAGAAQSLLAYGAGANGHAMWTWWGRIPMRADPTCTTYNPSAAASSARNLDDSTSRAVSVYQARADQVVIRTTANAAADADDVLAVHATADAELT